MADAEKIMAKCGDDEDCITREAMKMGAALQGTPQMDAAMKRKEGCGATGEAGRPALPGLASRRYKREATSSTRPRISP